MTRLPRLLLALLATLLAVPVLLTSTAGPAHACSCEQRSIRAYATSADAVFVATMLEPMAEGSTGLVRARAAVERVYAGDVLSTVTLETGGQGAACALTGLEEGRTLLFFASGHGAAFGVGSCDGNRAADRASLAEVEKVLGAGRAPTHRARTDDDAGQVDDTEPGWLESGTTYAAVLGAGVLLAVGAWWLRRLRVPG
ncbi:hypothetical protein [Nocardioides plantarum]|uniref:Tissue inhibitor of metalloproteinase n=1 Tax=Nocardioides plantarum TaxID=29299 RepID=A0ABV5K853_9ACTN|nr:hypothetical protein [Nocardioides plantarum]